MVKQTILDIDALVADYLKMRIAVIRFIRTNMYDVIKLSGDLNLRLKLHYEDRNAKYSDGDISRIVGIMDNCRSSECMRIVNEYVREYYHNISNDKDIEFIDALREIKNDYEIVLNYWPPEYLREADLYGDYNSVTRGMCFTLGDLVSIYSRAIELYEERRRRTTALT